MVATLSRRMEQKQKSGGNKESTNDIGSVHALPLGLVLVKKILGERLSTLSDPLDLSQGY